MFLYLWCKGNFNFQNILNYGHRLSNLKSLPMQIFLFLYSVGSYHKSKVVSYCAGIDPFAKELFEDG